MNAFDFELSNVQQVKIQMYTRYLRQIQMNVNVEVKNGDITIPYWNNVPANSRTAYGTIPAPGTVIKNPFDYEYAPDQKRFAVLICHIQTIQLLLLSDKHIRAKFKKESNWQGEWLSP